jgi:uncharacterized protein (DUF433 family)
VHYSFGDVIALRLFVRLRESVSLQRIRRAVAWLSEHHPETHLSRHALQAIKDERTIVWISETGDFFDIVNHPGDQGFPVVMRSIFESFETDSGRRVPKLDEPAPGVVIDPAIRGGYPVIEDTRVPFHVIAGLVADGVGPEAIRSIYPNVSYEGISGAKELGELVAQSVGGSHASLVG